MRKLSFITLLILCCGHSSMAQIQSTIYSCNGEYRIELPNKLELQTSELNNVKTIVAQNKKPHVNINTLSEHITFQQKGLNDDVKDAYNRYCRVIIEYFKEPKDEPIYGRGDQITVDRDVLYTVTEASKETCTRTGTPFIKLISVQSLTINGFPVLYYSYKRRGWEGKQPPVIVNVFCIFNRYESVKLTFSYREAEREMWKSIHGNIIKSFSFINKY